MICIHYGHKKFTPSLWQDVSTRLDCWIKPHGGLWTSPVKCKYGWKQWCKEEDFNTNKLKISFKLKLKPDAKICLIDSYTDLAKLPFIPHPLFKKIGSDRQLLDFETLARQYDAIYLTIKGEQETRFAKPTLYGWDCESVFIMNQNCFTVIK